MQYSNCILQRNCVMRCFRTLYSTLSFNHIFIYNTDPAHHTMLVYTAVNSRHVTVKRCHSANYGVVLYL